METAVENMKIGGQGGEQIDDPVRTELVDDGGLSCQEPSHRALHLRAHVLDVAVLLQVVQHDGERSNLHVRREARQVWNDHLRGVATSGHHIEQNVFHRQDAFELRSTQLPGAPQIRCRELEPSALAALIGGPEEADGLQIQDALVVGRAPARLAKGLLGPAVRIHGVVKRDELQPRLRIIGEVRRHRLQRAALPGLDVAVSAQQVKHKAIAFAVVRIDLEARRHQLGEQQPGPVEPPVQQYRKGLQHPGREKLGVNGPMAGPSQRLEHAAPGQRPVPGLGELRVQAIEQDRGRARIPQIR